MGVGFISNYIEEEDEEENYGIKDFLNRTW
jgi:hypothetical protein